MASPPPASPLLALLLLAWAACLLAPGVAGEKTIHTVFTTECDQYFNWQALAMYHSFRRSGQKGPITRLLSCTEEQLKFFKDIEGVPTHIAPSWSIHPRTGDSYSGINKPVAVKDWLEKAQPPEDYILIIDSDTIMREGFDVDEMGLKPGWAVSGFYGYLKGVNNELALKHIPQVKPRNDTLAGPVGRRSDQVGGFCFMSKADLQRMAGDWVSITEDVRADPDAWTLSGDSFTTHPGEKPWIAEMYGYSYAAAKADVWHHTNDKVMLYPGYLPLGIREAPKVLHYGIEFKIESPPFAFDKHWYRAFDTLACPPWAGRQDAAGRPAGGLFPTPPHPRLLTSRGLELLRDLLALEVAVTLNAALCERHRAACPPSQELDARCSEVSEIAAAVAAAQQALVSAPAEEEKCEDAHTQCAGWAGLGECGRNPGYMHKQCKAACGLCAPKREQQQQQQQQSPWLEQQSPVLEKQQQQQQEQATAEQAVVAAAKAAQRQQQQQEQQQAAVRRTVEDAVQLQQRLRKACAARTQLSLAQVRACLAAAQQGREYQPEPTPLPVQKLRLARPNLAGEEQAKAAPDEVAGIAAGRGLVASSRRLGEGRSLREEEEGGWEGGGWAFGAAGLLVLVFVAVFRVAAPRTRAGPGSHLLKGGRRD